MQHLPERPDTQAQAIDLLAWPAQCALALGELERTSSPCRTPPPSPRPWVTSTAGVVATYLLTHFAQACELDRALASGQRALAIAADLGRLASRSRRSTTWGLSTAAWETVTGAVECLKERGVSPRRAAPGALRPAWSGLVLSRSFLTFSLAECGAFAEGRLAQRKGCGLPRPPITPSAGSWRIGPWAFGRCARGISTRPSPCSNAPSTSRRGVHPVLSPPGRLILGAAMRSPDGPPRPYRCWSRRSSRPWPCVTCLTMHSGWPG